MIKLLISFGFIEPYNSPFSLLSLLNVKVLLFINFSISLNLFLISVFFFVSSSFLRFTNFWFSLLYLKELSENHNFHFDDILLIGVQNKNTSYLNEIKRNNLKINIFLFDDGVYTGTQLNSLLNSYISLCGIEFIQKIYITVPFLILLGLHGQIKNLIL